MTKHVNEARQLFAAARLNSTDARRMVAVSHRLMRQTQKLIAESKAKCRKR